MKIIASYRPLLRITSNMFLYQPHLALSTERTWEVQLSLDPLGDMERCHVAAPDLRSSYSTSKNTQASIAPPDGIVNVAKSQTTDLGSSYHSSVWQTSIHEDLADPMMGDNQGLRICQMVAKCCKIHVSKRSPTLIKNLRQSMVLHLFIRMFPLQVSYQLSCFVDGYIPIVVVSSAH